MMRCYHRTHAADAIRRDGFVDDEGCYGTLTTHRGVWLSDQPLDVNEGADGNALLAVDLPDELFEQYEWVEDGKGYREALIPAKIVNGWPIVLISIDDSPTR